MAAPVEPLDLTQLSGLTFFEPDLEKFPALGLARKALEAGGSAPNVLNAANEVAVEAFLKGWIKFTEIAHIVDRTLDTYERQNSGSYESADIDAVLQTDQIARRTAKEMIKAL